MITKYVEFGSNKDLADGRLDGMFRGTEAQWQAVSHGRDHREGDVVETAAAVANDVIADCFRLGGYPAKDDIEGWKDYLRTHGFEAFQKANAEGLVGNAVFSDPAFGQQLTQAGRDYEHAWEARSNLDKIEDRIAQAIIQNMRA